MNPEEQNPQAPLQSPVENGAAGQDINLGGDAARIAELEAKVAELTDASLRSAAEAQNARRRADEEVAKARKYAVEGFADSLLPVKDSLEAANRDARSRRGAGARRRATPRCASWSPHWSATRSARSRRPAGTKFDPHQHQAISMVPARAGSQHRRHRCCRRAT